MNSLIKNTIEKYYKNRELSEYLIRCKESIEIPLELKVFVKDNNIECVETNYGEVWPSTKITFNFTNYIKGEFEVSYSSTLLISKLAPVFYLQHEFQVESKDERSTTSTLDGFDTQPYNSNQQELEETIKRALFNNGYTLLSYREMNEVILGLEFNQEISFFGSQVTVEHALFFDLLGICPE